MRGVVASLVVVLALALAGCAEQEAEVGEAEVEEATLEETVEETASAEQVPPRSAEEAKADELKKKAAQEGNSGAQNTIRIDPNSPVPADEQIEYFRMLCQAYKASGEDVRTFESTFGAYFDQAMAEGRTVAEILSEEGFECTNEEIRSLQQQGVL